MKQVKNVPIESSRNTRKWFNWFGSISFWKICVIYMMSRLYVNVTQVYTPLYLQETLQLAKVSFLLVRTVETITFIHIFFALKLKRNIAIVPFITYFAGFVFSLLSKSKQINAKVSNFIIQRSWCLRNWKIIFPDHHVHWMLLQFDIMRLDLVLLSTNLYLGSVYHGIHLWNWWNLNVDRQFVAYIGSYRH